MTFASLSKALLHALLRSLYLCSVRNSTGLSHTPLKPSSSLLAFRCACSQWPTSHTAVPSHIQQRSCSVLLGPTLPRDSCTVLTSPVVHLSERTPQPGGADLVIRSCNSSDSHSAGLGTGVTLTQLTLVKGLPWEHGLMPARRAAA